MTKIYSKILDQTLAKLFSLPQNIDTKLKKSQMMPEEK